MKYLLENSNAEVDHIDKVLFSFYLFCLPLSFSFSFLQWGFSPLMRASQHGHQSIVEYLITKGSNVNLVIEQRDSAIMWAAARGHKTIVRILLQSGAIVEKLNDGKYSMIEKIHLVLEVSACTVFSWFSITHTHFLVSNRKQLTKLTRTSKLFQTHFLS